MSVSRLSAQQFEVIDALSSGATMLAAAEAAGIHRNTIFNWRRNQQEFSDALAHAHYDRALLFREQYEVRLDRALQILDELLADPKTPAAIRLKAALTIIEKASTPPPPQTEFVWAFHHRPFPHPPGEPKDAQSQPAPPVAPAVVQEDPPENPPKMHNDAQPAQEIAEHPRSSVPDPPTTIRRLYPKIGRNELCPCGSGKKFKRCCLAKEEMIQALVAKRRDQLANAA